MPRPSPEIRCENCIWRDSGDDDSGYARCWVNATDKPPLKHKSAWCGQHSDVTGDQDPQS